MPENEPRLKRWTPAEMVSLVQRGAQVFPELRGEADVQMTTCEFLILPRFNAIVRARPSSVRFYFERVHPRSSWRTRAVALLLVAACRLNRCRLLVTTGLVHSVMRMNGQDAVAWDRVDLLLAQWQFVGCFLADDGKVLHLLTDEQYSRCLENEIAARRDAAGVVAMPLMFTAVAEGSTRGYVEELILRHDETHMIEGEALRTAQVDLTRLYDKTAFSVSTGDYCRSLADALQQRYASAEPRSPARRVEVTARHLLSALTLLQVPDTIRQCRCHGDFNIGQVIPSPKGSVVIDWSESEVASVFHDLIYSSVWHHGWSDFHCLPHVSVLSVLHDYLAEEMREWNSHALYALMMVEVAVKQHGDYNRGRGTIWRWLRKSDVLAQQMGIKAEAGPVSTSGN